MPSHLLFTLRGWNSRFEKNETKLLFIVFLVAAWLRWIIWKCSWFACLHRLCFWWPKPDFCVHLGKGFLAIKNVYYIRKWTHYSKTPSEYKTKITTRTLYNPFCILSVADTPMCNTFRVRKVILCDGEWRLIVCFYVLLVCQNQIRSISTSYTKTSLWNNTWQNDFKLPPFNNLNLISSLIHFRAKRKKNNESIPLECVFTEHKMICLLKQQLLPSYPVGKSFLLPHHSDLLVSP